MAIVERDGEFLIGQRPAGAALVGLWEFPGGKVELGETVTAAAVRECLEETGVSIEAVGELSTVTHKYKHGLVAVTFVDCRPVATWTNTTAKLRPPFRWVPRADLSRYEFPEANSEIVRRLTQGANGLT